MQMPIEKRLQVMEDIQAIARLKATYCDAVDCGYSHPSPDGDKVVSLFVPEGVWDGGSFGRAEGHKEIRELFKSLEVISLSFHRISNPLIEVNENEAIGKWHLLSPGIVAGDSMWIGGVYNDEFVRTPQGWKFTKLSLTIVFTGKNDQGWDVG